VDGFFRKIIGPRGTDEWRCPVQRRRSSVAQSRIPGCGMVLGLKEELRRFFFVAANGGQRIGGRAVSTRGTTSHLFANFGYSQ